MKLGLIAILLILGFATVIATDSAEVLDSVIDTEPLKWEDVEENDYLNDLKSLEKDPGNKLREMVQHFVRAHVSAHKAGKEFCGRPVLRTKTAMEEGEVSP